ncbi:MAG: cupin [Alphaproteobacteria bacterium]|nr:cupin [Alphaproteobacteria bacterium]
MTSDLVKEISCSQERTEKPWGFENLLEVNKHYALKEIFLRSGTRSSLQMHRRKHETIFVISGRLELEIGKSVEALENCLFASGAGYVVPPGYVHRVTALEDVRLVEVSTPELDDIVRLRDDYGRS